MSNPFVSFLIQGIIIILLAPLLNGIIRKIKALSQHRKGAPVLQLYFDLIKLFKKDIVVSDTSSWIFKVAPYIYFATALIAAMFVPVIPQINSFGFVGDSILAVYILAMGRFFITLSSLDTGSTFGGMGSSRELMISSLIEPSILVSIFTLGLSKYVNSTGFSAMFNGSARLGTAVFQPVYLLLFGSMVIILIAETARIPVDDPATHLELTMVHEAMVLEYSGKYLALIEFASSIKQLFFITIIVNVFMPFGFSFGLFPQLLIFLAKVIFITVLIGIIEINSVKLRLFSVPNLAALAFILSMLGFMSSILFGR